MKLLLATIFSVVLLTPAWSATIATLTFKAPTGTALDTDSIDIWLTLTLDAASDPLVTDSSGFVTPLPSPVDIAPFLFAGLPVGVDENSATSANVNEAFGCSGTFNSSCTSGPPYDFTFNFAPPSFIGAQNLNLLPGSSTDFLFGTFTPTGGKAPAGTYVFPFASFFIQVYDDNASDPDFPGSPLHIADIPIADTGSQPAFTRDILATSTTPEPATYTCILAGLALAAGLKRARAIR